MTIEGNAFICKEYHGNNKETASFYYLFRNFLKNEVKLGRFLGFGSTVGSTTIDWSFFLQL